MLVTMPTWLNQPDLSGSGLPTNYCSTRNATFHFIPAHSEDNSDSDRKAYSHLVCTLAHAQHTLYLDHRIIDHYKMCLHTTMSVVSVWTPNGITSVTKQQAHWDTANEKQGFTPFVTSTTRQFHFKTLALGQVPWTTMNKHSWCIQTCARRACYKWEQSLVCLLSWAVLDVQGIHSHSHARMWW